MENYIGIKLVQANPMLASEANEKGYKIGNNLQTTDGYEIIYPDGYKSWSSTSEFEKYYFRIQETDKINNSDVSEFIYAKSSLKIGNKTTNTTLTLLNGFEINGQASCVNPDNYDIEIGENYAVADGTKKIWELLGFVLQWAKYGLKKK